MSYLLPHARNTVTGQTVKTQDLTGARFKLSQRAMAMEVAQQVADKMAARTGDPWTPFVVQYEPTSRR